MLSRRVVSLVTTVVAVLLFTTESPGQDDSWIGREATRSRITLVDVDGVSPNIVLASPLLGTRVDARRRWPDRQRRRQAR
jgi:hypothetical protein